MPSAGRTPTTVTEAGAAPADEIRRPAEQRPALPATADEAVRRARALRPRLAALAAETDRTGEDPAEAMRLVAEAGLAALAVPVGLGGLGGLWEDDWSTLAALAETWIELSAGDGAVGQIWAAATGQTAAIVLSNPHFPESTRSRIAQELLHEGRRVVGSRSETGVQATTTAQPVVGGIVISGTKSFNTGSGALGRDLAIVSAAFTEGGAVMGLVRLDADGVRPHHDWQVMGQRATNSQTITYDDVFVPNGWYAPITPPPMQFLASARLMLAAVLVGIGEGALDAGLDLMRRMDRATLPGMPDAESDHLAHRRIGEHRIRLAAARALLLRTAAAARTLDPADPWPTVLDALASTAAGRAAALEVTSGIFDLTGARSTTERNRLDRFWRNARTLSLHDPVDATTAMLGKQLLTGEIPALSDYFRLG